MIPAVPTVAPTPRTRPSGVSAGDTVNDAPAVRRPPSALRWASAGPRSTGSRDDRVLADDNFATIVAVVDAGRPLRQPHEVRPRVGRARRVILTFPPSATSPRPTSNATTPSSRLVASRPPHRPRSQRPDLYRHRPYRPNRVGSGRHRRGQGTNAQLPASPPGIHRARSLIETSTTRGKTCRPNRGRSSSGTRAGQTAKAARRCLLLRATDMASPPRAYSILAFDDCLNRRRPALA